MDKNVDRVSSAIAIIAMTLVISVANGDDSIERMAFLTLDASYSSNTCRLYEFGASVKPQYFEFEGKKTKRSGSYCNVTFDSETFHKYFRFCSISDYDLSSHQRGVCSFGPSSSGGYLFSADVPEGQYFLCNFVCLAKSDGNKSRER